MVEPSSSKSAFLTVGTTSFDALVRGACRPEVGAALVARGFRRLVLQIGEGEFEPPEGTTDEGLEIEWFRLKPSIEREMVSADLIISHCGAGSVLEALGAAKPLIVVVNVALMADHQAELADKMVELGHCLRTQTTGLAEAVTRLDDVNLVPFPKADPKKFARIVDALVE